MKSLKQDLEKIVSGEVLDTDEDLKPYSEDASVFVVHPKVVVKPKSVKDVQVLVKYATSNKKHDKTLSLTARSGGTDMSGGPLNESIIVDFNAHLNKLLSISKNSARVQPGMFYRDFEKQTLKKKLLMPTYPASRSICTVGGMVANNSGGEKSLVFGQTKNFVRRLKVILSDGNEYVIKPLSGKNLQAKLKQKNFEGNVYRRIFNLVVKNQKLIQNSKPTTSKNSSGYFLWDVWDGKTFDLTRLISGSQGTLGLVSEIEFKLIEPNKAASMLVIFMKDIERLGDVVTDVLKNEPESFESYDEHTFNLAMKYLPELIRSMKGGFFSWAFQFLPEIKMVLTGGLPELVLIAEFTGKTKREAEKKALECKQHLEKTYQLKLHMTKSDQERQKYWVMRRESFNLLRHHSKGLQTAPFVDDIIVHPEQLPEFLPKLNKIFSKYKKLIYTVAGHAGDANFHIIPLMDLSDSSQRKVIPKLSKEVYDLVLSFGGSITAEHNDGLIRTPYLEQMYGRKMTALFKQVKNIFDPQNIFNPGKKVGRLSKPWQELIKKSKP